MKVRILPCAFNTHCLKVYAIGDAPKESVTLIFIPEVKLPSGFGLFIHPCMHVFKFWESNLQCSNLIQKY